MSGMRFMIPGAMAAMLVIAACSSKTTSTSGNAGGARYSEDLSVLRTQAITPVDTTKKAVAVKPEDFKRNPTVYLEPRHAVNQSLDAVLDSIDRINISNGLVDGFTIQLYSGSNREEALNVKKQVTVTLPEVQADVQFVQPNFRVRAGKYISRLEAHRDYTAVKKYFPNAIIIPERIPLNK